MQSCVVCWHLMLRWNFLAKISCICSHQQCVETLVTPSMGASLGRCALCPSTDCLCWRHGLVWQVDDLISTELAAWVDGWKNGAPFCRSEGALKLYTCYIFLSRSCFVPLLCLHYLVTSVSNWQLGRITRGRICLLTSSYKATTVQRVWSGPETFYRRSGEDTTNIDGSNRNVTERFQEGYSELTMECAQTVLIEIWYLAY